MSNITIFNEKLNKMLFLEISNKVISDIFKVTIEEEIFFPIHSSVLIDNLKNNPKSEKLDITNLIEGMFFVLGCDEKFKYSELYKKIIKGNFDMTSSIIKKSIANLTKDRLYVDAYIMLKGYASFDVSEEIYDKLIWLSDSIRLIDNQFKSEELYIIQKAKDLSYASAYFYESNLFYLDRNYEDALISLNNYISSSDQVTEEIEDYRSKLIRLRNYELGKEKVYLEPVAALELLLPLLDEFSNDAILYYYIAVAYRVIKNHYKAIYYLNEALFIDKELVDVVNELGLNYASLADYENAIKYFNIAFKASNSIEICTNLILCFMNTNDIQSANKHLQYAVKINPDDEVLLDLEARIGALK